MARGRLLGRDRRIRVPRAAALRGVLAEEALPARDLDVEVGPARARQAEAPRDDLEAMVEHAQRALEEDAEPLLAGPAAGEVSVERREVSEAELEIEVDLGRDRDGHRLAGGVAREREVEAATGRRVEVDPDDQRVVEHDGRAACAEAEMLE